MAKERPSKQAIKYEPKLAKAFRELGKKGLQKKRTTIKPNLATASKENGHI